MTLIEQINDGIKEAMRARDTLRLNTLRMLKSKILAVDARASLSDAEIIPLFKTYLSNLQEACEQARSDMLAQLHQEMHIVQEFLPKALSPEETALIVDEAIQATSAKAKKDLGLVMKHVRAHHPHVDGKLVKELTEERLS